MIESKVEFIKLVLLVIIGAVLLVTNLRPLYKHLHDLPDFVYQ